ncbi:MAG: EAL domain-containing protein [Rhodocyclaceae bacterium]|nr:EAL domain-containing protein [Rhodocyclaceae bacterium]MBX3670557.1 EAL domain-containing protein [Rhodocyclaceae bacterium]
MGRKTTPSDNPALEEPGGLPAAGDTEIADSAGSASDGAPALDFPIVGIGASAGGLEALKQFFTAMPPLTGVAFVLIQHLDPNHQSLMADLLAKYTSMPVAQADDGMLVEPDHVYVIPPNHYLSLDGGRLHLSTPTERRGMRMPIDHFLRSLAEDLLEKAICVILSGTGSDGTLGLREIKGHGGMTMVQEPTTAQYDGMPHSALATGLVDYRLPVDGMPEALLRYVRHSYVRGEIPRDAVAIEAADDLSAIITAIRTRTGHDFRHYKKGTLGRRIARRMGLAATESMREYLNLLRNSEDEVHKLVRDLLISVTSFFREPAAFEMLAAHIVPPLVERALPEEPLRIWVPGCASGEEAYSLAMLFMDGIRRGGKQVGLQIFATDIDAQALEVARAGIYPVSAASELPGEFLRQFFTRDGDHVAVNKSVREQVIFAQQNLITDPPFSRLDLISCRNLLIYLDNEIQTRVVRLFHFALREGGYLFLGNSETIGQRADMFRTVSKKWRVYRRLSVPPEVRGPDYYSVANDSRTASPRAGTARASTIVRNRLGERVEDKLLKEYAPAAVLVDRAGEAIYYHGNTADFLEIPPGTATHDVLALARDGLRTALRAALQKATRDKIVTEARRIAMRGREGERKVRLTIWPVDENEGTFLICFDDEKDPGPAPKVREGEQALVTQLEYELKATREDLQTTIEEVETANEELKAANEEVMSMNEELQSTNEELETSKEELQSLNEELSTVNNQLLDKVHELEAANNDLANLLTSTEIATIFLDAECRVRRYTPPATRMFALIEADLGRPIGDVAQRFRNGVMTDLCRQVLSSLKPFQEEVRGNDGNHFLLRILPYRTTDNRIDGVVITFSDITEIKQAYAEAEVRERHLHIVADSLPALIAHVDMQHRFRFVNGAYERWFGIPKRKILGEPLCTVFGAMAYENLCPYLEQATSGKTVEATVRLRHETLGEREVTLTWVPEIGSDRKVEGFYSLIHDVTEQKKAERRLLAADVVFRSTTEAAAILDDAGHFSAVNPAFEKVTGYSFNQCSGESWEIMVSERGAPDMVSATWGSVRTNAGWRGEAWLRRRNGEIFAAWVTIDEIRPLSGGARGYVAVFADISTVKESEKRLEFLAHHDPLTGLSNRFMFHERVTHVLTRVSRQNRLMALLYLDLDGFKNVNDSYGHEVGDQLLIAAANRLKSCVRAEDTLARLGGDEFAILLEEISEPWGASLVADKIIESMRTAFVAEGHELILGVSVGISVFPGDGNDAATLIRNADTAMYRAKERGGNVTHFYTPALTETVQERVATENALRRAMEQKELELYFQPVMAIGSGRIVGAEALLRWRAPGRGILTPDRFLPIAELSGLIVQVGQHVLDLTCAQIAAWRAMALPLPRMSVNVSARQCMDEAFPETLAQILSRHGISANTLDLEITESCFLDKGSARKVLPAIKALGVSLTIDDFGTGYSTFLSLRQEQVDSIKIDRAFVDELVGHKDGGAIARAVIVLGRSQGLRVVAEGVETRAQLDALAAMQCDACQGFLVAPPMTADQFQTWLEKSRERVDAV